MITTICFYIQAEEKPTAKYELKNGTDKSVSGEFAFVRRPKTWIILGGKSWGLELCKQDHLIVICETGLADGQASFRTEIEPRPWLT